MEVTRTRISADFGYDFFQYRNETKKQDNENGQDKDVKYFETFTFPKDQGLSIVAPDLGEKIDIELKEEESKIVILRLTNNVYEKSIPLGFNMVLGDDSLV